MELMSKSAQAILDEELANYKNKLASRAVQYAERDGKTIIGDKQIMAAIRDYGNLDLSSMQKSQRREKARILVVTASLLVLMLLVWFSLSLIYLTKNTQENVVFFVGLMASIVSLLLILLYYVVMRKGRNRGKSESVVSLIEKWNEFESLLRYTYKGQNKGGDVSISDLIEFYLNTYSEDKDTDERIILSYLRMRNNIVHRGINQANVSMLERNMSEMDKLIEKMKA